jgi:integrase/recombinase XerD
MSGRDAYRPHCLKQEAWPRAFFQAWEEARRPPGLFDECKPAAQWRPATVKKVIKGFGVYLHWLQWRGLLLENSSLASLVTLERAREYQAALTEVGCAPLTIYSRVQELHLMMGALAPQGNWSWLGHAAKRIRRRARPIRQKLQRLQPINRLERLGIDLMSEASAEAGLTMFKRALLYRDGLMIALLAHRPLRLKNFAALRLGTSLILDGNTASIIFPREEMKGKRPLEIPFPDALVDALQTYVFKYRPWLLSRPHAASTGESNTLWISNEARSMAEESIRNMIKRRTRKVFGVDLTPHLFRDCAVTSMVRDAPASARLTRDLLGHASLDVTTKHYNQALMVDASRRYTTTIENLLGKFAEAPIEA